MKIFEDQLKKHNGYLEGKSDAIDSDSAVKATAYKKDFLKKFIAINPGQIDSRLGDTRYWVTRKYDGEYANLFYENGKAFIVNRSGRVRTGLPCTDEAAVVLKKNGIKQAIIPAEIYRYSDTKRTRVNDLIHALNHEEETASLRLACYDIMELNGQEFRPEDYGETLTTLDNRLKGGRLVHGVDWVVAKSNSEVKNWFTQWVEEENSEGLVVRSEMPFVWKIKPRHTLDAVIIGFTEGTGNARGQVRTMLLALMPEEGKYQLVTHVGGGMKEQTKRELHAYLTPRIMPSEFVDTDSNFVAFQMVEPDKVVEISVNDVRWETPNGYVQNAILQIVEGTYQWVETVHGISFVAPIIERFRDDKQADAGDVRLSQIENFASFEPEVVERVQPPKLRPSELLFREVYRKTLGKKIQVLKFTGWKTNKEMTGSWPKYVLHVTNFSSERKQRLQREVRITDDKEQLFELRDREREANVKKGWEKVEEKP